MSHKNFNAVDRGDGSQPKEQDKADGGKPLRCCTYGGGHHRIDCPQNQGGLSQIYSAQEAYTVGDISHSIHEIYGMVDNRQVYHYKSIIKVEGKLCNQVVSILVDPISNYSYISPDLMDKCFLSRKVHAEYWLV